REAKGDCGTAGCRREPRAHHLTASDGNSFTRRLGRDRGTSDSLLGGQSSAEDLFAGRFHGLEYFDAARFSHPRFHAGGDRPDGDRIWAGACIPNDAAGCRARAEGRSRGGGGRRPRGITENAGGGPGGAVAVAAHRRGPFSAQFEEPQQSWPGISRGAAGGFQHRSLLGGYIPERSKIYYQQLTNALSSVPGVESVGLASMRILENDEWDSSMTVEGY